jgi:excisionase family DNA binding protein
MSDVVSANEAARRFGLSEKTVRRWIAAGKLEADKRGRAYRVSLSEVAALNGQPGAHNCGPSADSGQTADNHSAPPTADSLSAMSGGAELVALVARLHDEVKHYAEAATLWQARAHMLEDRIRALEAPRTHTAGQQAAQTPEPDPEPPEPPRRPEPSTPAPIPPDEDGRQPWWRRWWAWAVIAL